MAEIEIKRILEDYEDLAWIVTEMAAEKWETQDSSYTDDQVREFVSDKNCYLLVAFIDGKVAGMLVAYNLIKLDKRKREMFLYEIETKIEFRKQGVGKALILKLAEIAKAEGSHEIWVLTDDDNIPANALYSGTGLKFERTSQIMFAYDLTDA